MGEVNVVAWLSPAPGKYARAEELLLSVAKNVHANESGALRYVVSKRLDGEDPSNPDLIITETYKDQATADAHMGQSYIKELFAAAAEEGLVAEGKPPVIAKNVSVGGFERDRKLF